MPARIRARPCPRTGRAGRKDCAQRRLNEEMVATLQAAGCEARRSCRLNEDTNGPSPIFRTPAETLPVRQRMMQIDALAEAFAIEVGVNLGRDDRLVPEHLLHLTDARAALEQMREPPRG